MRTDVIFFDSVLKSILALEVFMAVNRFIFKYIAIFALVFAPLISGDSLSAAPKENLGTKAQNLDSLMASLRIQPLASIDLPHFSLPDTNGNNHSTKNYSGKVLLLNFWTTH